MLRLWWVPLACLSLLALVVPASADGQPLPEPWRLGPFVAAPEVATADMDRPMAQELANLRLLQALGVQLPPWLAAHLPADAPADEPGPQPAPPPQDQDQDQGGGAQADEAPPATDPPQDAPAPVTVQGLVDAVAPVVEGVNARVETAPLPELDPLPPAPPVEAAPDAAEHAPGPDTPPAAHPQSASVAPAPMVPPAVYVIAAATAVAAVGGASLAAPGLGPRTLLWLARRAGLVPLFSRLAKSEILDHGTRQRIVDAIDVAPGLAIADLQSTLDLSTGTIRHHLRALEANGLVVSVQSGRRRCFFRAGACGTREARVQQAALSAPAARRVFGAIRDRPGIRQRELARTLGVTPTSIIFHARRLEAAGVVRSSREGRALAYFPTTTVGA